MEYVLGSSPNQRSECDPGEVISDMEGLLTGMGRIKTSKTFPSLCRASMDTAIANLETLAKVQTIDYNGSVQDHGGDPVVAQVIDDKGGKVDLIVEDRDDGSYEVRFTAHRPGTYCLKVCLLQLFVGFLIWEMAKSPRQLVQIFGLQFFSWEMETKHAMAMPTGTKLHFST